MTDPYKVFSELFAGAAMSGGMPDPNVARNREMKKSILDNVVKDLNRFSARVGSDDRVKIEAHLQSIRDLEADLERPLTSAGMPPTLPAGVQTASTDAFETTTKMMIDISVAALAADATRVVVLQLGDQGDSDLILSSLGTRPVPRTATPATSTASTPSRIKTPKTKTRWTPGFRRSWPTRSAA